MPIRQARSGIAGKKIDPNSEAAENFIANQESSPLLRLPPELRRMIYEHVLGGNRTIFVDYKPHRWATQRVDGVRKWTHVTQGGFCSSVWPTGTNPFTGTWIKYGQKKRSSSSGKSKTKPKPVAHCFTLLSRVCRQLYRETAAWPMAANTWAFASPYVMSRYLIKEKRMSLAQRRALRVLFVPTSTVLTKTMIRYLAGLQMVYVNGEVVVELDADAIRRLTVTVERKSIKRHDDSETESW